MSIEAAKTVSIQKIIKNLKVGCMSVIDMTPEEMHRKRVKGNVTPAQSFQMSFAVLQMFEAEIVRRGMDPRHPSFGPDITAAVDKVRATL